MMMMPMTGGYSRDGDNNANNANNNNNNNNDVINLMVIPETPPGSGGMTNKKRLALIKKGRSKLNTLMPIEIDKLIQDKIHLYFGKRQDQYGKQDTKDTTLYEAMMKFTSITIIGPINQNNKKNGVQAISIWGKAINGRSCPTSEISLPLGMFQTGGTCNMYGTKYTIKRRDLAHV